MVYHVLPEVEPFSEQAGGALSRWAANALRNDPCSVICPWADRSWGFDSQRLRPNLGMHLYGKVLKYREFHLRIAHRVKVLRWIMKGVTAGLRSDDVVYIHNRPEYILALPPAGLRPFKVVLHMHNDHLVNLSERESSQLDPDLAVFNSAFLAEQGTSLVAGLRRTAVLHNGADENFFYPASRVDETSVPVILFVGRLIPEKGIHILIAAMRLLHAGGTRAVARIIGSVNFGDGRSSDYVDALRASAPENVEFKPYVAGRVLADEFRKASIFCCPSTWEEPFGMVNVEAMASGLPVVATRSGGIPEIFSEGGALLVPKDSPTELADALQQLVVDPALRRRLAREGLASYRKRFRWGVIASEYQKLIDGLQRLPGSRAARFAEMDVRTAAARSA